LIISKSPFTPNIIYRYNITEKGLDFSGKQLLKHFWIELVMFKKTKNFLLDYKQQYDGEDLNLQNIKTKPFVNLDD
jgi:hypothetical protein